MQRRFRSHWSASNVARFRCLWPFPQASAAWKRFAGLARCTCMARMVFAFSTPSAEGDHLALGQPRIRFRRRSQHSRPEVIFHPVSAAGAACSHQKLLRQLVSGAHSGSGGPAADSHPKSPNSQSKTFIDFATRPKRGGTLIAPPGKTGGGPGGKRTGIIYSSPCRQFFHRPSGPVSRGTGKQFQLQRARILAKFFEGEIHPADSKAAAALLPGPAIAL